MENKTEMGLLLLIIGMLISIFATLITAATSSGGGNELSSGSCLSSALGLFSLSFLLVGLVLMLSGRKDFGEKHSKFVMYSLAALVIGVIIVVVSIMIITVALLSGGLTLLRRRSSSIIPRRCLA